MLEYERKAERIIMDAYNNGGTLKIDEILKKYSNDLDYISESVANVLNSYGDLGSNTISSEHGWTWFKLSEKGMEFARTGCFTGERKRGKLTRIGAIAAIIAAIAGVISLFL